MFCDIGIPFQPNYPTSYVQINPTIITTILHISRISGQIPPLSGHIPDNLLRAFLLFALQLFFFHIYISFGITVTLNSSEVCMVTIAMLFQEQHIYSHYSQ